MLNANSVLVFTDPDEGLVYDFTTGAVGLAVGFFTEPAPQPTRSSSSRSHYRLPPVEFKPQQPVYLTLPPVLVEDDESELLVLLGVL